MRVNEGDGIVNFAITVKDDGDADGTDGEDPDRNEENGEAVPSGSPSDGTDE